MWSHNIHTAVDDGVRDVCGVAVRRFKCLSLGYANSHSVTAQDLQLQDASAEDTPQLAAYLSTIDIAIVGNTYGDAQTSLLLDVVHLMRASNKAGGSGAMNGKVPQVMIDLPNLEVPSDWQHKIDALIAPSKATGLHRLSISLGKYAVCQCTLLHTVCLYGASSDCFDDEICMVSFF